MTGVASDEARATHELSQQAVSAVPVTIANAEVIQADRDAAAAMWRAAKGGKDNSDWQAQWMTDGTADSGPVVQAFAVHRVGTNIPPAEQIGAMARRMLELAPLAGLRVGIEIKPAAKGGR